MCIKAWIKIVDKYPEHQFVNKQSKSIWFIFKIFNYSEWYGAERLIAWLLPSWTWNFLSAVQLSIAHSAFILRSQQMELIDMMCVDYSIGASILLLRALAAYSCSLWCRQTLEKIYHDTLRVLLSLCDFCCSCFSLLQNTGFRHSKIKCDVNKHGFRRMWNYFMFLISARILSWFVVILKDGKRRVS